MHQNTFFDVNDEYQRKTTKKSYFNQHSQFCYKFRHSALTPVWPDRDDFITLNEDNMLPDQRNNFVKRPAGDADFHTAGSVNSQNTPYDVLSVILRKWVFCISSTNHRRLTFPRLVNHVHLTLRFFYLQKISNF